MARETYVYRDGQLIPKHLAPPLQRSRGQGIQVIKDIEPYKAVAVDGRVISGRRQHREMLRNNDLIEVGDQAPREMPPPPPNRVDLKLVETIKRAMGKL